MAEVSAKIQDYMTDAFEGEPDIVKYLDGQDLSGQVITMVNGDKIAYLRCGVVKQVVDNNTLCI